MNREIKFRAWDKNENVMVMPEDIMGEAEYFFQIDNFGNIELWQIHPDMDENGGTHADKVDSVFMQYTGLKDRNGKEIYEGDFLQSFNDAPRPVTFTDYEWKIGNTALHTFEPEDYEIIGNIYENPDLIK